MGFIKNAHRHQEQTTLGLGGVINVEFDIGLFQLDLTILAFTGDGVFQFQLGEEANVVVELVAKEQHKAMKVDLFLVAAPRLFVIQVVVM